jgi:NADP-dependent 3-hydroxy acid dehydrogenase YdfG
MNSLTNQVAVITGASSGIGKAIASALSKHGAIVYLVGRNAEALKEVADHAPAQAHWYQADLTNDEAVQAFALQIQQDIGYVDILIHSAGFISLGPIETASLQGFDRHYFTNVRAPYALTQALLPMLKKRQGQIVFINSSAGLTARANVAQYAASKHALKAIADSLREEINSDGIRVVSIFPGRTATPMQAAVHQMEGKDYHPDRLMQPEDIAGMVVHALSLPRSAELTDIMIRPLNKPQLE